MSIIYLGSALFEPARPDQLIYLARSFSHGSLSVDDMPLMYPDYVIVEGHTYLPVGPLSALVLVPFLPFLDAGLSSGWLGVTFTLVNIWMCYRVLGRATIVGEQRRWALLLFFCGTVYFPVAVTLTSWYFAHVLATTCLLVAMYEALGRSRPVLIGLSLGLATMTRLSTIFSLLFFLWMLLDQRPISGQSHAITIERRALALVQVIAGLAGPLVLLMAYNYARFHNPFETGYGIDVVATKMYEEARSQGLFSLEHIPKNLFALLLQGPVAYPSVDAPVLQFPYVQPTPMGMSILFTSPALVFAVRAGLGHRLIQACWLAVFCVLIPLLTHYATGWIQFGFRYSLDLMPFLLVLATLGFGERPPLSARILVIVSVLINLWGVYWLQRWL